MAMRQAEHLCPHATFVLPDEEAVARIGELLSAALYDLAPVVEVRDEGVAWLDLEGVVRRGESIREMRRRLLAASRASAWPRARSRRDWRQRARVPAG